MKEDFGLLGNRKKKEKKISFCISFSEILWLSEWVSEQVSEWLSERFVTDKTFHNPESWMNQKAQEEVPWMSAAHFYLYECVPSIHICMLKACKKEEKMCVPC